MLSAIIIDDETHCLDDLIRLLDRFKGEIMLLGTAMNVAEAEKLVLRTNPDLVFLDVQLGRQTGFDFLRLFEKLPFEVIFTTAFDKYAIEAIKFSAFDYLLKPIDFEILDKTIQRLTTNKNEFLRQKKWEVLYDSLKTENLPKKIILPTQSGFEVFEISEILYCEGDANYSNVYLSNKSKFVVSKSLKYLEELLTQQLFYRIHKSYLVNIDFIKKYHKGKGGYVELSEGSNLDVSQRRKEGFLKFLKEKTKFL